MFRSFEWYQKEKGWTWTVTTILGTTFSKRQCSEQTGRVVTADPRILGRARYGLLNIGPVISSEARRLERIGRKRNRMNGRSTLHCRQKHGRMLKQQSKRSLPITPLGRKKVILMTASGQLRPTVPIYNRFVICQCHNPLPY